MKILAIDTSSAAATVALLDNDKLIGEYTLNHKKSHSEKLMPMIQELLDSLKTKPEEIDVFAVSLGPGSFTGLRIGIATITAMANALDKTVVGVSSLEALAYNLFNCPGLVCPIIDAQRDIVYMALYKWENGNMIELIEPNIINIDELINILKEKDEKIFFLGDGLERFSETLKESLGENFNLPPHKLIIPSAASVGEIAKIEMNRGTKREMIPIYMRKSQAEIEFEKREKPLWNL